MTDWTAVAKRNARSVQTTVGWIFWDPGAVARYEALGLPEGFAGPLGYIASRCAPLAPAGPAAVTAAFGSISPLGIAAVFDLLDADGFARMWAARDEAVREGLARPRARPARSAGRLRARPVGRGRRAPGSSDGCSSARTCGWPDRPIPSCPGGTPSTASASGGATRTGRSSSPPGSPMPRRPSSTTPGSATRSTGWRCPGAPRPRPSRPAGGRSRRRAWRRTGRSWRDGIALRQQLEDDTDRLTAAALGAAGRGPRRRVRRPRFEPSCELLLRRVDDTAGPNYQPASRVRAAR